MTRKITLVAMVAMLAIGTSAALVVGAGPVATDDAAMAQETTMEETTTAAAQETTTAMTQETTASESADVTITEQTSNGSAVVVDEVVVPEGGFVVIHAAEAAEEMATETEMETDTVMETDTAMETEVGEETPADEEMAQEYTAGEVLGNSTYLDAGTHENVTVELDAPLDESQVVIAMPHLDTNDNQVYEFPEADDPYTEDGAAVTDWANVTVGEDAGETMVADEDETTVADEDETTTEEM